MKPPSRRTVQVTIGAVVLLAAAGLGAWFVASGGGSETRSPVTRAQVALPPVHRPGQITARELRRYPPIALVLADRNRASSTAEGDLYVVHADGSGLRRLKAWASYQRDGDVVGTYDARWSPDRSLIALDLSVWFSDAYGQAAVISPNGRHLRTLSKSSDVGNIAWSRQGALAYTYDGELRVVSPGNGRTLRIWRPGEDVLGVMGTGGLDWAPDGKRLLLQTSKGVAEVTLAGRRVAWLPHTSRVQGARWSPSGRRIAFIRLPRCYGESECKAPANLYLVRPDGSARRRLTEHANADSLVWSPDGRSILYSELSPDGLSEGKIAVVSADGRHLRRLASDASALGWSPDGTKILYSHRRGLWLMDADGGRRTRLLLIGRGRGLTLITADWAAERT